MRLGILTAGGDCPGLNALIRAVVMRAVRTYDADVLGVHDGWLGLLQNRVRRLDFNAIAGILPRGGTMLGTSRVDPFREPPGLEGIRETMALHELDGLLVCGGDGSLSAAHRLSELGIRIIGIPKTIDNDVPGTDYSFGFDTAVNTVMHAVDALHTTAEAHNRVIVLEVMGRGTGWIAVSGGIAGGADVIVSPEEPVCMDDICRMIEHRHARGREFSIVVVAEGATFLPDADGRTLTVSHRHDPFGRPQYGGVGEVVAGEIQARTGFETRTVALGYVQRGGTPTAFDRLLASRMGVMAVDLAARNQWNQMTSLQGTNVTSVDLGVVRQGARGVEKELNEVARVFSG
jgi:6-phosphofructokinase 1